MINKRKSRSHLHLLLAPYAAAAAWCFRMAKETPDPVSPYVAGGVFFVVSFIVSMALKIDRENLPPKGEVYL